MRASVANLFRVPRVSATLRPRACTQNYNKCCETSELECHKAKMNNKK